MNKTFYLQRLADVIYKVRQKPISIIESCILEGILDDKPYWQIAEETNYTEGHISDLSCDLIKIISAYFQCSLNKKRLGCFCKYHLAKYEHKI